MDILHEQINFKHKSSRSKMDASLVSALYLVPHWMTRLLEEYEDEVDETHSWAVKLLEREGRKAVWYMCTLLGVDASGVPGQACRLLERYLATHMREFINLDIDNEDWEDFKRVLASRIPLLIATCVQLAAKMNCAGVQVNANIVRTCLLCKGIVYSVADIIDSEFQMFSTLGFRVPLWTSVEAAQLMAVEVGLPASMLEGVALVVDLAEYRRDTLDHRVRAVAHLSPGTRFNQATLRTLHLAGGAVVAGARYLGYQGADPTARVAGLTRAPPCYVKCVCDVILADVLVDDTQVEGPPTKRKRK